MRAGRGVVPKDPMDTQNDPLDTDDTIIEALDAKRTPRLIKIRIETACRVLDISLDGPRLQFIDRLDSSGLEALLTHLETERSWP